MYMSTLIQHKNVEEATIIYNLTWQLFLHFETTFFNFILHVTANLDIILYEGSAHWANHVFPALSKWADILKMLAFHAEALICVQIVTLFVTQDPSIKYAYNT